MCLYILWWIWLTDLKTNALDNLSSYVDTKQGRETGVSFHQCMCCMLNVLVFFFIFSCTIFDNTIIKLTHIPIFQKSRPFQNILSLFNAEFFRLLVRIPSFLDVDNWDLKPNLNPKYKNRLKIVSCYWQ